MAWSLALASAGAPGQAGDAGAVQRGEYLLRAGGCVACHTDLKNKGPLLAGGGPLKTPFGTFYAPNITPDPAYGIGGWREADFVAAMTRGVAPDGSHYYPVFPYPSFTRIDPRDLADLWAYLRSLPPVARPRRPHELPFPFSIRLVNRVWNLMFFTPGAFVPDSSRSPAWNRGAYLVTALGHCGECHTPRNILGGVKASLALAGNESGPDGKAVPNITPDAETGLGEWSESDIVWLLQTGLEPDGDTVGGAMVDVVEHGTSHLNADDRRAIAIYLKSLPATRHRVKAAREEDEKEEEEGESDRW